MADKTEFELVSPERLLLSEPVNMVVVPGSEGDFGVLPQHAPMIANVRPGVIDVHNDGRITDRIFVAGGVAEVTETRCTVLAEEAVRVAELTREKAENRLLAAQDALASAEGDFAKARAEAAVKVAQAMMAAVEVR